MNRQISILKDIVIHPSKAFREISEHGDRFLNGALVILILSRLIPLLIPGRVNLSSGAHIFTLAILFVNIILTYYLSKIFKGKSKFTGLFSAIIYTFVAGFLIALIWSGLWSSSADTFNTLQLQTSLLNSTNLTGEIASNLNTTGTDIQGQLSENILGTIRSLFTPLNITLLVLIFVIWIWSIILNIIVVREANKFKTWKALLVFILASVISYIVSYFINLIFRFY